MFEVKEDGVPEVFDCRVRWRRVYRGRLGMRAVRLRSVWL